MRRGFVTQAEKLALTVREELGLSPEDHLDCDILAQQWGVPVVSMSDLVESGAQPASIKQLTQTDPSSFSAGTVLNGAARLIVFNPVHPSGRKANSLAHEIAHLLLEHEPGPAIGPGGCRIWDPDKEEEADRLAGVLLVPRDAALACAKIGLPLEVGAARYGVSTQLMRQRINQSGAARQAHAAAKLGGRKVPLLTEEQVADMLEECDLAWLADLDASQWRALLFRCRGALTRRAVPDLVRVLQTPVTRSH
jgi:Zn-dependent peptidase ImmA (M78 family)